MSHKRAMRGILVISTKEEWQKTASGATRTKAEIKQGALERGERPTIHW